MCEATRTPADSHGQDVESRQSASSRKRARRLIQVSILAIVLSIFGRYCYLRITRRPTPRHEYWRARLIENQRNASFKPTKPWAEAEALINSLPWRPTNVQMPPNSYVRIYGALEGKWDLNRGEVAFVNEQLLSPEFQQARDILAEQLVDGWREPILNLKYYGFSLAREYSSWPLWLLSDARRALATEDDWDRATTNWLTCFRLARQAHLHHCALPISHAASIQDRTSREIRFIAAEVPVRFSTSRFAAQVDEIIGPIETPSRLFSGQRLSNLAELDAAFVADGGWLDVSESVALCASGPKPSRLWNITSFLFNNIEQSRSKVNAYFEAIDEIRTLADVWALEGQREKRLGRFLISFPDGRCDYVSYRYPDWGIDDYLDARMSVDAALAVLALSAFRESHGTYPDRLEELVPEYLPRLPIDYADMQPMRYRRDGDSYRLYSIGRNLRDDGGTPGPENRGATPSSNDDTVFSGWARPDNWDPQAP